MACPSSKTPTKIIVNIKPVKLSEVTPAQAQLVRRFWAKLITQVKDDLNNEQNSQSGNRE